MQPRRRIHRHRRTLRRRALLVLTGVLAVPAAWGVAHAPFLGRTALGALQVSPLTPTSASSRASNAPGPSRAHREKPTASRATSVSKPPSVKAPHSSLPAPSALPTALLLRVTPQDQFPALPNGCEVTSLSMLLGAIGHPVSKMRLASLMPLDPTPRVLGPNGRIVSWGNPNVGFVGSVYVLPKGFGIYHGPLTRLVNRVLPGRGIDLTGHPFTDLLAKVAQGIPVVVWTTIPLSPDVPWVTWQSPEGPVHTTMDEHAVLLVGYGPKAVYINNPYNGEAAEAVPRARFIASWNVMGKQAVTTVGLKVPLYDRCVGNRLSSCAPVSSKTAPVTSG